MNNKYFAIFGGGGVRGIAYCGAYKVLAENNIELTGCAGSSIGAVFASLLSVGYDYKEIYEILAETGFEMFIDINIVFKKEVAFSKGNIFYDWIKEKIERKFYGENYKKGLMRPVTFSDIKKRLIIYSVDLTNMKFNEFSQLQTPDFEIAKAVRASVSMPGLFTPLEIDGNMIVDGDLLKPMPLWRASNEIKNLSERIIEFRLEDNESKKDITNSIEYLNRVYNAISGFATDFIIDLYGKKDKFEYIKINTEDISVVDFLISKEQKKNLFNMGYTTTLKYFATTLSKKRKEINKKYCKLSDMLISFTKSFHSFNVIKAYLKICELFMYLCEEKQYIDNAIYDKILEFKNLYLDSNNKIKLFNPNQKRLSELLLEINKQIGLKIEETKS